MRGKHGGPKDPLPRTSHTAKYDETCLPRGVGGGGGGTRSPGAGEEAKLVRGGRSGEGGKRVSRETKEGEGTSRARPK